jgi:hypothetical protein
MIMFSYSPEIVIHSNTENKTQNADIIPVNGTAAHSSYVLFPEAAEF